jgi:hypothetical protein
VQNSKVIAFGLVAKTRNIELMSIALLLQMVIADVLKVSSSLTSLELCKNPIQQEGAMAIADVLKVNSSLTSLKLNINSIQ